MKKLIFTTLFVSSIAFASLPSHAAAPTSTPATTPTVVSLAWSEGVSDYTYLYGDATHNIYGAENAQDIEYYLGMTAGLTYFTPYVNADDYDTDYVDYEYVTTGHPGGASGYGEDQNWFDANDEAISYFSGHGQIPPCIYSTCPSEPRCNHTYECPSNHYCIAGPNRGDPKEGYCEYQWTRGLIVSSPYSQLPGSLKNTVSYGGDINHGGYNQIALGESVVSGGYGLAGTNGGTNAAWFQTSFALPPATYGTTVGFMAAGVHHMGFTTPIVGDTAAIRTAGSAIGYYAWTNPNSSAVSAFLNEVSLLGPSAGTSCPIYTDGSQGGGGGYSGCGANIVLAYSNSNQAALASLNENWYTLQSNNLDQRGNSFGQVTMHCNYNCYTWPFVRN